jgi:uncharacterized SAM-binding protein YcdF (DUF218 family)
VDVDLNGEGLLYAVERFLRLEDPLESAHAIYVLCGGDGSRHRHAACLYRQGYAPRVVIAQAAFDILGYRFQVAEYACRRLLENGVPRQAIFILPGQVKSTQEEAISLEAYTRKQGWRKIILVSDAYHTRRVRLTFRKQMREPGIMLMVSSPEYSLANRSDRSLEHKAFGLFYEMLKLLYYFVRGRLAWRYGGK